MASIINASTSTGLVTTADTSGVLQLQTGGTTALAVSAAQVVTLTNPLPVASGGSGGTTSTGTGANVLGTTPSFTSTIGVGGATASASGAGITFPSTDLHYSTNANTLDDYEEGTFTPTIVYSGTNTPTSTYQLGRYTKVGRIVQLQMFLSWNENGSTGNVTVGNLPFTSVTSLARSVPSIASFGLTGLPVNLSVTGYINSNATTVSLFLNDNAGTILSATYTDNDQDMYVTVTYEAV